jgi:hypothetical protein
LLSKPWPVSIWSFCIRLWCSKLAPPYVLLEIKTLRQFLFSFTRSSPLRDRCITIASSRLYIATFRLLFSMPYIKQIDVHSFRSSFVYVVSNPKNHIFLLSSVNRQQS